jgi:hypothetical protein
MHPAPSQVSWPLQKAPSSQYASPVHVKPEGQSRFVSQSVRVALLQVLVGMVVVQESVVSLHRFNVHATLSSQSIVVPAPQHASTHETPAGQSAFEVQILYGGLLMKELQTLPLQSDSWDTQDPPGQSLAKVHARLLREPPEHNVGCAIMQFVQTLPTWLLRQTSAPLQ